MKLTIHEIAQSLYLPLGTVRRWIRQGRIPIHKSGNGFVFNEAILSKWAAAHHLTFSPPKKGPEKQQDPELETLSSALKRGGVFYDIKGDDGASTLKAAVEHINVLDSHAKEKLYQRLLERENLTSTGIGKGVAIPHPHNPLPDANFRPFITTCFLEKPIEFAALDNKPVFVMFILLCPSVKSHLYLLSRLAFCIRDDSFVEFLKTFPSSDRLLLKIADFEEQLDRADRY
ncbi:MAG: PTS sugar transporter subunit IIA [Desulfobacterales bacterium]|nr:MAG: PTS sugar transporter subunit IIA [Desulfobacterales bacterium]